MEAGTKYWLEKFMLVQARHYSEELSKSANYNKAEKLFDGGVIHGMRLDEHFKNFSNLENVYIRQALERNSFFESFKDDPSQAINDFLNQIN